MEKKLPRAPGSKLALSVGRLGRVAKNVKNVNMVDLRIVQSLIAVISSLTAALSLTCYTIITLLLELKNQRDVLISQVASKQSEYVRFARLKRRGERKPRAYWKKPGRTEQWWLNLWQGVLPEEEWKTNLRMSRPEFVKLAEELRPFVSPDPASPNRTALSTEKKLALTLYFLKDMGSLGMTANVFGVAISTVSVAVYEVCQAIATHLGSKYIRLPRTEEEMRELVVNFESRHGFPQAFGCVDGTHVAIKQPLENSHDFFSYKMKYTLNVQGICDYQCRFIDVDCRWPGSVHDAKVFSNSHVNSLFREGKLPLLYKSLLPGYDKVPVLLLGDPAYTLLPHCMKEFPTCTTNGQVMFNNLLRSARNPIECAVGRLKARWQILNRRIDLKLEHVPQIIYACFVLHNFCEINRVAMDDECVQRQIQYDRQMQPNTAPDRILSYNSVEGVHVREVITEYIKEHLPDHL